MSDFATRITTLVDASAPPVDIEELVRQLESGTETLGTSPVLPPGRAPGWAVAVGAAVAVVVLIGGVVWLVGGTGTDVVEEPTVTTTYPVPTTVAPVPVPPTPPIVDVWQRVGEALTAQVVGTFDMTSVGSQLFVVGFDPGEDDSRQNGVIFASDDGVNWVRLAEDDPALTLGAVLMYAVTEGGPGLVAVGVGCENEIEGCPPHATVWTSVDGTSWTRSPEDPAIFGGTSTQTSGMVGVADTSHGLVAVGSMEYWTFDDEGVENLVTIHPTAWISDDGITWERAWESTGSAVDPNDYIDVQVSMDSVVEGPDGLLVGVGATLDENGESIATVWTSSDGRQWERIEPDNTVFTPGTVILDVAVGEHGYVAVGTDDGTDAAIWQSPDGATWRRVETAAQSFDGVGSLESVASLDAGYITVGPNAFIDATGGWVTVWTSPDGATWDRVHSILTQGYTSSVVVIDGAIAVSGGLPGTDNVEAAVWVGPRFDPDAPPPDPNPPAAPDTEEDATGIMAVEEGVSCEQLATEGYTYAEAVSYFWRYDRPWEWDLDADGPPCAEAYTDAEVAGLYGESGAVTVELISSHPIGSDIFEASGPAVDAGLVCAAGTIDDTENPDPTEPGVLWRWEDEHICDDGSGTFVLGLDVYFDDPPNMRSWMMGTWNIVSGTGAYETLRGGGATEGFFDSYDISIGRLWYGTNDS
jgi:hypothetical protein